MSKFITGIQQVGIGVSNATEAMHLYKELFGMNVKIFDDTSAAVLMTKYTGDTVYDRHAILTMNLSCGGGFEIWQFISRTPSPLVLNTLGDIGINAPKLRTTNILRAHKFYTDNALVSTSEIISSSLSGAFFWVRDSYGNLFQIVESNQKYMENNFVCGGVCGAVIGVTNMDKAIHFYANILGIENIVDTTRVAESFYGEEILIEKVLLSKPKSNTGAFSNLLGDIQIELVQVINRVPIKIFANRYWGDCGHIHLCFDVLNMDGLKQHTTSLGGSFTVDSLNSFSMENAAGRFCYIEDPDGTLIELVETHKIPILKKMNWYLNLQNRKNNKPLPKWMIGLLGLSKV